MSNRSIGDPSMRKSSALNRLRHQLKKKKESLADHFDFKLFVLFHFKGKKNTAIYEVSEVLPVMTNNFEETILKGAKNETYSKESSLELLNKDVVQFHAPRWQSLRRDVIGCTTDVDYFLWPRNDIDRIECRLFSRWKGDKGPHRLIQAPFEFFHLDYEKQLVRLLAVKDKNAVIIHNPEQSVFLFIDKLHIQTSTNTVTMVKLSNVCVYLPQDQLTHWAMDTVETTINPRLT